MDKSDTLSCVITSWIVAAVVGLIIAALLYFLGDWGFIQGAFAGVIGAIIVGFIFTFFMCPESTAKADLEKVRNGTAGAAAASAGAAAAVAATTASAGSSAGSTAAEAVAEPVSDAGGAGAAAAASASEATTASKPFEMQASKPLAGEAELAERKGDWKYEGAAEEPKKAPAKKAAAKKAPAKKAPAKKAAAKSDSATAKPKRAPVAADGKPETLKTARSSGADDLKLISGVGPKMEGMLNDMGFWHFDQVASWRKKEVQWVNDNLDGFKGRIERDDWVSQAKILAKGGETEFSKRKK